MHTKCSAGSEPAQTHHRRCRRYLLRLLRPRLLHRRLRCWLSIDHQ